MDDGTLRQRLAALGRTLGTLVSPSRWMEQERARRLARLEAALSHALPAEDHPKLTPTPPGRATRLRPRRRPETES